MGKFSNVLKLVKKNNLPKLEKHLQGKEAVKMFKEYGGQSFSQESINGQQLLKYVPEVRERYGLVGNTDITDEEIAQALYKHVIELGGDTKALNAQGEPQLLFRGDTKRYTQLIPHGTEVKPTDKFPDNLLGTLFLDRPGIGEYGGPDRYLIKYNGYGQLIGPYNSGVEPMSPVIGNKKGIYKNLPDENFIKTPDEYFYKKTDGYPIYINKKHSIYKVPSKNFPAPYSNDLNGFVIRTPKVYDMTDEFNLFGDYASMKKIQDQASKEKAGLLVSKPKYKEVKGEKIPVHRDEHDSYTYMAVPDDKLKTVKHILPYDIRIPRDWTDPNIYRVLAPVVGTGISFNYLTGKYE